MEWFLLASVLFNWWQWGEMQELEVERDLYRDQAKLCDEARKDAKKINIRNADQREETEKRVGRIIARSELDIRRTEQALDMDSSDSDCAVLVSPAGSARMEEINKRTRQINEALRPTSSPARKKKSSRD